MVLFKQSRFSANGIVFGMMAVCVGLVSVLLAVVLQGQGKSDPLNWIGVPLVIGGIVAVVTGSRSNSRFKNMCRELDGSKWYVVYWCLGFLKLTPYVVLGDSLRHGEYPFITSVEPFDASNREHRATAEKSLARHEEEIQRRKSFAGRTFEDETKLLRKLGA